MRYFYEMFDNKFGFDDGNAIPPDAEASREVYIRAVNRLADQLGSSQRLVAFDCFGMHNTYLILLYPKQQLDEAGITPDVYHQHTDILPDPLDLAKADAEMDRALEEAQQFELDDYIVVSVAIEEGFSDFLSNLKPSSDSETGGKP